MVIVQLSRPYPNEAFPALCSECFVDIDGHRYWCADSGVARIMRQLGAFSFDDRLKIGLALNQVVIDAALQISYRSTMLSIYQLRTAIFEMERQQAVIDSNPEMAELMDDPEELSIRIRDSYVKLFDLQAKLSEEI